jgi:hypothetical protein
MIASPGTIMFRSLIGAARLARCPPIRHQARFQPNAATGEVMRWMKRSTLVAATALVLCSWLDTAGWPDPPTRNAVEGPAQFPGLLNGYPARPPWKVAGVDYGVGIPPGTELSDIANITRPGVLVDPERHWIRVTGNDVRLTGYDFSRDGGWGVYVQGARNLTIENCLFVVGKNNVVPVNADAASAELTISHSTIDGGGFGVAGAPDAIWSLVHHAGTGLTVEYNWLKNAPQHVIEFKDGALIYRNNLVNNLGFYPIAHTNAVQFGGSHSDRSSIAYNTIFNPPPGAGNPTYPGELIQVEAQLGSTIANVEVDHNTVIAFGPPLSASFMITIRQDLPGNRLDHVSVHDNYLDAHGAYGAFYPPTGSAITYMDNRDLRTGRLFEAPRTAPR